MKNFKDLLSEVAQPKSPEEKAFKDQHKIELIKHPVAPDYVHTGEIPGKTKKERPADVKAGEDEKKYDGGAAAKAKPFKMPRNIDEDKKLKFKDLIEKLSDKEDLLESPQEEISMMIKQLHFICYASEEIMEYLGAEDLDPEEWWQNKLAVVFSNVKSLFAYAKGSSMVKTDIEQDDDLGVDDDDDIVVPDDAEVDNIMNSMYEGFDEELEEANFKPGSLRLKDGQTVKLDFNDVKHLNNMLKGLAPKNKKEMEDQLMKDKKGFDEILGFAVKAGV